MTLSALLRSGFCVATLVVVAGEAHAQSSGGIASVNFTVNVKLTKLHPTVKHVDVRCHILEIGIASLEAVGLPVLVNQGVSGTVPVNVKVPLAYFDSHPDHTVTATCELWFYRPPIELASNRGMAIPSATQPVPITDNNWLVVDAGSTVKWTQVLTFPNAAP